MRTSLTMTRREAATRFKLASSCLGVNAAGVISPGTRNQRALSVRAVSGQSRMASDSSGVAVGSWPAALGSGRACARSARAATIRRCPAQA